MKAFFTDLDNTLIYSHRREIPGGKVCVERLEGREQSFATERTFRFFGELDWLTLVPVTTRSETQYRRLDFRGAWRIRYAILCNGGKLLADGREDPEWTRETMEAARDDAGDLERAAEILGRLSGTEPRRPEPYYYYTTAEDPEGICAGLRERLGESRIAAGHDHRKVYLFPECVNKGEAVRRFKRRFGAEAVFSAGDSRMDVPMLNEAAYAFAPEAIAGLVRGTAVRLPEGGIFSDRICAEIEKMHSRGTV